LRRAVNLEIDRDLDLRVDAVSSGRR